jgi:LacI family transcriptional regulator
VEPKLFLPPFRVIVRQSTDTRATDDPFIAAALSHIRANVSGELRVKAIADAVGVGRRELERRFRKALNCSVLDDIRGVRIQRVKELLAATDLAMPAIARRSGFSSAERLAVVFRQVAGMTPKAYRRRASARG